MFILFISHKRDTPSHYAINFQNKLSLSIQTVAPFISNILLNLFLSHTTDTLSLCN